MNYYNYIDLGIQNRIDNKAHLYRFKNIFNDNVIVEVFEYKHNVYAIKFYLKKHSLSQNKYFLTYDKKFLKRKRATNGCKNLFFTLNTILNIAVNEILKNNTNASFGFMGAPKLSELQDLDSGNVNDDGTIANTTRYRMYFLYVKRHFNPEEFEYIISKTSSIVLLRNNRYSDKLTKDIAEKYIKNDIIPSLT